VTDRNLRVAVCVLAAAGAAIAAYLLYERWSGGVPICSTGGCETVQNSRYSKVAGVPVALLGLLAYAGIFVTGLVFALYLVYVQNSKIHAWCQWCLASDAVLAVLTVVTVVRLLHEPEPEPVAVAAPERPAVQAPRRRR
jgi:uncharacterized membrane protein